MTKASQFLTNTERDAVFDLARKSLYGQNSRGPQNTCNTSNFINTPPANAAPVAKTVLASTNVLQGVVACLSSMSDDDKDTSYHQLIVELGGSYQQYRWIAAGAVQRGSYCTKDECL